MDPIDDHSTEPAWILARPAGFAGSATHHAALQESEGRASSPERVDGSALSGVIGKLGVA